MVGGRGVKGRRLTEDEMRDRIREVKDRHNLSDIISRKTTLKRAGRELRGLCFVHEEKTPSLYVNDQLGVYLCRGCSASGDLISAVMEIEGLDFMRALRWLGAADLPKADPAQRVKAVERDEAERSMRAEDAAQIWKQSVPLAGTLGETYLASRCITAWPTSIRFARTWWWCNYETGEVSPELPAVIGMVQREDGFSGIQRIFLRQDGAGKAALGGGKAKLSLGGVRGGALRLGPAAPTIHVCEGPEDGLSLAQEMPGISVWVALGTANMPQIRYPATVRKVVICAQNDAAGERATEAAAEALADQGYMVDVRRPRAEYKDWNDQLCAMKRAIEAGTITSTDARSAWGRQLGGATA